MSRVTPPPLKKKFPLGIVTAVSLGLLVAGATAAISLLFSWNLFVGKAEWAQAQKELLDRGEKLDLLELVPPPVPNEVNFFADPLWVELYPGDSGEPRLPKGQRRLDILQRPATDPSFLELTARYPEFSFTGSTVHQTLLKLATKEKTSAAERRRRAAEFTLAAMQESEPVLNRIVELAQRPESAFPVDYTDGLKMKIPHITYILMLGQALKLRAGAEMTLGDREAAYRDVLALQQLARVFAREPTLIFQLVRLSVQGMALDSIAEGLKEHRWTDAELAEFQRIFAATNFIPDLALALRGERGVFNQIADGLRKSTRKRQIFRSNAPEDRVLALSHDQAFANRLVQQWIDAVELAPTQGLNSQSIQDTELVAARKHPINRFRNILSLLFLPLISSSGGKFAWTQEQIQLTEVACALERYRLQQGDYPETLTGLVPDFLPKLPVDVVTLGPISYRKDDKEGFLLWTPGWDEKDDHATPATQQMDDGDWVWGRPLKKKTSSSEPPAAAETPH